jgi:hypothetical protein
MLKSQLIAAALAVVVTAREAYETAVRELVSAEQGPGDFAIFLNQDASNQIVSVNGSGYGGNLAAHLGEGEEYQSNPNAVVVKSHAQPAPLVVVMSVYDGNGNWSEQGPVEVPWTAAVE